MDSSKITEYRKSIKFELVRAQLAFEEFFGYAGGFITDKFDDTNVLAKIKIFDAYARWVGHLYESMLALVKIEDQNSVSERSKSDVTDPAIQFETQKSLNRFNALVQSGKINPDGHVSLTLDAQFASDLRKVRNKCSFHCTNNRVRRLPTFRSAISCGTSPSVSCTKNTTTGTTVPILSKPFFHVSLPTRI